MLAQGKVPTPSSDKQGEELQIPLAAALWARVSDEIAARLKAQKEAGDPYSLRPQDWTSGENIWVLGVFGHPDVALALLKKLSKEEFAGKTFELFSPGPRERGRATNVPQADPEAKSGGATGRCLA
jgi:hemolysin-activating ACP:hemolysin acyltransferase